MVSRGNVVSEILLLLQQTYTVTVFGLEKSFRIEITFNTMAYRATYGGPSSAIKAIRGLVALTALGMDWTEDDTVKTTMNGISNITFIKLRHACRTEVLKNGDGRTDGRVFSLPRPRSEIDRTRRLLWPYMTATD